MLLSIIVRAHNRLEYTIRTINSIDEKGGLSREDYEIIVVDQASTDGTREWLSSIENDNYYPVKPIFLPENIGDGEGMQEGINSAKGEFIAQHDNDIVLESSEYYKRLIFLYEELCKKSMKVCALAGSHIQGGPADSAPFRFAMKRHGLIDFEHFSSLYSKEYHFLQTAWATASFIFKRKFAEELDFNKRMCNAWCGEWFDRGYDNIICTDLKFWHIDSGETGAHVQKQADKFPDYKYVKRHYKNFIKRGGYDE